MKLSIREYKKGECIVFKSTKAHFGALSNMAPNFPITINGHRLRNVELLYQALRFPDYPEIQKRLISFASPISAKRYGRRNITKTRLDWNKQRFKIMKMCLEIKLAQNFDTFSTILLATKNLPIVEYTDKDKVWGATLEGEYYVGTNALGRLLMELREKVKTNNFHISIPEIDNLKFLDHRIKIQYVNHQEL
jgi:ribA/ribD-fused uncharacterized protein